MDACSTAAAVDARTAAVSIAIDSGISGGGGGGGSGTTERMRSRHCFRVGSCKTTRALWYALYRLA